MTAKRKDNDAFQRAIEELHRMYDEFPYERLTQWVGEKRAKEIIKTRELKKFDNEMKEILDDDRRAVKRRY